MNASQPKRRAAPGSQPRHREAARELSVYDGNRLLGTIQPTAGSFVARDAGGKRLGRFDDDRSAMRRICQAAREAATEVKVASA